MGRLWGLPDPTCQVCAPQPSQGLNLPVPCLHLVPSHCFPVGSAGLEPPVPKGAAPLGQFNGMDTTGSGMGCSQRTNRRALDLMRELRLSRDSRKSSSPSHGFRDQAGSKLPVRAEENTPVLQRPWKFSGYNKMGTKIRGLGGKMKSQGCGIRSDPILSSPISQCT